LITALIHVIAGHTQEISPSAVVRSRMSAVVVAGGAGEDQRGNFAGGAIPVLTREQGEMIFCYPN
jgi:hypothetical protein